MADDRKPTGLNFWASLGGVLVGGVITLFTTVYVQHKSTAIARQEQAIKERGQVDELFTHAIDQLGSEKRALRLGGIYALEQIYDQDDRYHEAVTEILSSYLREFAAWNSDKPHTETLRLIGRRAFMSASDIQAAIRVLGRKGPYGFNPPFNSPLDLNNTDLEGADLTRTELQYADLRGANLRQAVLEHGNFEGANFTAALLEGVTAGYSYFKTAVFENAHLDNADLTKADLESAKFVDSYLRTAIMIGADLRGADLSNSDARRSSPRRS